MKSGKLFQNKHAAFFMKRFLLMFDLARGVRTGFGAYLGYTQAKCFDLPTQTFEECFSFVKILNVCFLFCSAALENKLLSLLRDQISTK